MPIDGSPRHPGPPYEYSQLLQACLAVRQCISFTVCGFGDADSSVPSAFAGEGYAVTYDVDLHPKAAYRALQRELRLAGRGAPRRVHTYRPRG